MRQHLPPLKALRAFEAAARHGSVSRAAEELHVTQSAVSQQVRALERHVGLPLFRRIAGQIELTPEGRDFFPPLRDALDSIDAAAARLAANRAAGVLTVSLLPTFAMRWLIPRLGRFQARQPEIEVRLVTTARQADLRREDIDAAIRYGSGQWPDLHADLLMTEDMFPVCAPRLLSETPALRTVGDLARHTLLLVDAPPRKDDWTLWLEAAGARGLEPAGTMKFESSAQALEAALAGLGLVLAHRPFVVDDLAEGRLVAPFETVVPARDAYYLVYHRSRAELPRLRALRDWLLDEAKGPCEDLPHVPRGRLGVR